MTRYHVAMNYTYKTLGILADPQNPRATDAAKRLAEHYTMQIVTRGTDFSMLDAIVALGGDGFMLHTLHHTIDEGIPIYGMNCGTVGFLMNEYREEGLLERINQSVDTLVHPLFMEAISADGTHHRVMAINEVSLLRAGRQAARLRIRLGETVHMENMVCDGVLISTPAGSSAYNYSIGGPIIPLQANLLALTPISPFRPRRWRGALLPQNTTVNIEILEQDKRPVNAVADFTEIKDIISVAVHMDTESAVCLLFDPGHSLEERILKEQFAV